MAAVAILYRNAVYAAIAVAQAAEEFTLNDFTLTKSYGSDTTRVGMTAAGQVAVSWSHGGWMKKTRRNDADREISVRVTHRSNQAASDVDGMDAAAKFFEELQETALAIECPGGGSFSRVDPMSDPFGKPFAFGEMREGGVMQNWFDVVFTMTHVAE